MVARALERQAILGGLGVAQKVSPVIQRAIVLNPALLLVVSALCLGGRRMASDSLAVNGHFNAGANDARARKPLPGETSFGCVRW